MMLFLWIVAHFGSLGWDWWILNQQGINQQARLLLFFLSTFLWSLAQLRNFSRLSQPWWSKHETYSFTRFGEPFFCGIAMQHPGAAVTVLHNYNTEIINIQQEYSSYSNHDNDAKHNIYIYIKNWTLITVQLSCGWETLFRPNSSEILLKIWVPIVQLTSPPIHQGQNHPTSNLHSP